MNTKQDQKLRVIWHETGHYLAQQLNKELFAEEDTDHIYIKFDDEQNDYTGGTVPKNSSNEKILNNPAPNIASVAYGCLIQSLTYGPSFEKCFASKHEGDMVTKILAN